MSLTEIGQGEDSLEVPGVLSADVLVRLVDVSWRGCLLESSRPLAAGTAGRLSLEFGGVMLSEELRVARCQQLDNAGTVFRLGTQFLQTGAADVMSLRHAVHAMSSEQNDSVFVEYMLQDLPVSARGRPRDVVTLKGAKS